MRLLRFFNLIKEIFLNYKHLFIKLREFLKIYLLFY